MNKDRLIWIDNLKGFTIIFVVIGHLLDGYYKANLFDNYRLHMRLVSNLIRGFHMPLFFMISGYMFWYAYGIEKNTGNTYDLSCNKCKVKMQMINLSILYVMWSVAWWSLKFIFSNHVNNAVSFSSLLNIPIVSIDHLWYLYVLVLVYLLAVMIINKFNSMKVLFHFSVICILADFYISYRGGQNNGVVITAERALYFMLFFSVGIIQAYHKKPVNIYLKKSKRYWSSGLAVICSVVLVFSTYSIVKASLLDREVNYFIFFINALIVSNLIFSVFKHYFDSKNIFSLFGRYSLEIYLTHSFITAGNRVVLPKLGITTFAGSIIANFLLAIIVPVVMSYFIKKTVIYTFLFRPYRLVDKMTHSIGKNKRDNT